MPVSDGSVPAVAETGPRLTFTNDSALLAAAAVASDRHCARTPGT
jgi:hypothetical protein